MFISCVQDNLPCRQVPISVYRHTCVLTRLALVNMRVHVNMTLAVNRNFWDCTQKHVMYTESTACLHDTVSCQQGYLGLLTCLGLVSTHRSHCLCTPLLHATSSLHTFTAQNTSIRDCTQMSCPLLVKMPSPAQHRHAGALRDDKEPVSFQIN